MKLLAAYYATDMVFLIDSDSVTGVEKSLVFHPVREESMGKAINPVMEIYQGLEAWNINVGQLVMGSKGMPFFGETEFTRLEKRQQSVCKTKYRPKVREVDSRRLSLFGDELGYP